MTPRALHNLALTLYDAADFICGHTEPGRYKILNEEGYFSELRSFAETAAASATAIQSALRSHRLKGGAQ